MQETIIQAKFTRQITTVSFQICTYSHYILV